MSFTQDDFALQLELNNQEFLVLNKTSEQIMDIIDQQKDFVERAKANLQKYKTDNYFLKKRRDILLKIWNTI